MAPQEDDFILTISDNDQSVSLSEEDDNNFSEVSPEKQLGSNKRKRDLEEGGAFNISTKASEPLPKKPKKKKASTAVPDGSAGPGEEQTSAEEGEDDGAMNSDFEFQVGDPDAGITDGFDPWDINGDDAGSGGLAVKKGVDINELIAKWRHNGREEEKTINSDEDDNENEDVGELGWDDEPDSENESGVASEGDDSEEEDETLAADGFGMGITSRDDDSDDTGIENGSTASDSGSASDEDSIASPVPHPDDEASNTSSADDEEDAEERMRQEEFFAPEERIGNSNFKDKSSNSFQSLSLSRPILRGLASLGFSEPTPIQARTIPVALLGKDVVGGAVTGSGKTAAFIVPILERLLYRPKKIPTSRVAILMPTRELAVQCFKVAQRLASFTDITFCQLVGGFSLREQETILRKRPDVIIATPGRFIDHMRNSAAFKTDALEILVLDEADRMLEDGFADELNEILTTIPRSRQTMLFSATMTDRIDKLIRLGLNKPVRLLVDVKKQTVTTLVQEFVRLRPGREEKRLACLLYLCSTVYTSHTIVFFRSKKDAHRARVVFGLCGIQAGELHGSMSQEQRLAALAAFRSGETTHLLATDLASRGLDVPGVACVLNYTAPQSLTIYLHRVGRTARAGAAGRACTLAAEPDRKVVKAAVRAAKAQGAKIVSRAVDNADVDAWDAKVRGLEAEVEAVLKEEKELRALGEAEMQLRKGENLVEHREEIMGRPKRTWFETEKQRQESKAKGAVELNGVSGKKEKKGKLSNKVKKRLDAGRERREGNVGWRKGKEKGGGNSKVQKKMKNGKGKGKGKGEGKKREKRKR
ncbi:MAG: hypothetical protein LQ342_003192 [Letrouitia transgressa]|nr:MAG: hypothetical protein LQ342_003192 [Letrouitia transgressa]